MRRTLERKDVIAKYVYIFSWLVVLSFLLLLVVLFFTHGNNSNAYFFQDPKDVGMDFFNSIVCTKGRHPYTQYNTVYPPLANMLFWLISRCMPTNSVLNFPNTLKESVANRGTEFDLRTLQIPMIMYSLYIALTVWLIGIVVIKNIRNNRLGILFSLSLILNYASISAIERGNIILLAFAFLCVYIEYYDSENRILRELAYISLAISAGLKLYPALFGVLLISKNRAKDVFRTLIYGLIFFGVPFLLFDGLDGFRGFVHVITGGFASAEEASIMGYNLTSISISIVKQLSIVCGFEFNTSTMMTILSVTKIIKWIIGALIILFIITSRDCFKKTLGISMVCLLFQNSVDYTLLFAMVPIMVVFKDTVMDNYMKIYFVLLVIIFLNIPIMYNIGNVGLKVCVAIKQYMILLLLMVMIMELVKRLLGKGSKRVNI